MPNVELGAGYVPVNREIVQGNADNKPANRVRLAAQRRLAREAQAASGHRSLLSRLRGLFARHG